MAKCDLSIELDHPDRVYDAGETITGTIHVIADANVNCKSLDVKASWRTHGRGNVAKGPSVSVSIFSGKWTAGQQESYRFELTAARWPPSYHGHYINVDHYIGARAKIAWAFDPKASQEIIVRPSIPPDDLSNLSPETSGCAGTAVATLIGLGVSIGIGTFLIGMVQNLFFAILVAAIGLPIGLFFALRYLLPRWLLGNVECELSSRTIFPGDSIRAKIAFRPRRLTAINAITATLTGSEVCYSGSGSDRTQHTHKFFDEQQVLQGQTTLDAGARKELDLQFDVPVDVPFTFKVTDNSLNWKVDFRVDIPKWPDWTKSIPVNVIPNGAELAVPNQAHVTSQRSASSVFQENDDSDEITFDETAGHFWGLRDDPQQAEVLVDAVSGLTFDIEAFVERRLLYSGDDDPHVYRDGYAVWARYSDPPLPLALYIPHELGDDLEQAGRDLWKFRGTIVGWDHSHRRLQIKVLVS